MVKNPLSRSLCKVVLKRVSEGFKISIELNFVRLEWLNIEILYELVPLQTSLKMFVLIIWSMDQCINRAQNVTNFMMNNKAACFLKLTFLIYFSCHML